MAGQDSARFNPVVPACIAPSNIIGEVPVGDLSQQKPHTPLFSRDRRPIITAWLSATFHLKIEIGQVVRFSRFSRWRATSATQLRLFLGESRRGRTALAAKGFLSPSRGGWAHLVLSYLISVDWQKEN